MIFGLMSWHTRRSAVLKSSSRKQSPRYGSQWYPKINHAWGTVADQRVRTSKAISKAELIRPNLPPFLRVRN